MPDDPTLTTPGSMADAPPLVALLPEHPDALIGRYKLLEKLGEGGFGVVYVAEQKEPVKRRVALKIIKLGMDTRQVVARFEAERQALAMMDHPNIAKVLDAGATDTGRPFFVMELVRGIRITDYCDQHKLPIARRLELFMQVCHAIQHAHQKGIIHRDIKPSNILVTLHDGTPIPKVIDFGIAKATQGDLTDKTVYTHYQQFIGTPAYMSPEQAEMSGLDVDTRSDIYSLGVLLYELLTGRTPFDGTELVSMGIDAMRKAIREREPIKPSTKLATLKGDDLQATAARHASNAMKLVRLLHGDLDWIVMKCLEKDRTRRYETANALAADLKRHLNNDTVSACPPSSAYRLRRLVRRNKLVFAAATAVACSLILGIAATTWQAIRAREAAEKANRAEAMALQSRGEAEKLSNFMLEDLYWELAPTGRLEIVAALERKALDYYDSLPPSLRNAETERNRAVAQVRLALISAKQGEIPMAKATAATALNTLEHLREQGDQSEETLYALGIALLVENSTGDALAAVQHGIDLLKPAATSPRSSSRIRLLYGRFLDALGHQQPYEEAVNTAEEALRILVSAGASDWSDLAAADAYADAADSEAIYWIRMGRLDDAERLEKQTLSYAQGVLARRPGDLWAMADIALAYSTLGLIAATQFNEAEAGKYFSESQQAAENFVRCDPSSKAAWSDLGVAHRSLAERSYRLGHVEQAIQEARAAMQWHPEGAASNRLPAKQKAFLYASIAYWEAQRGNRAAAEEALQEATRFVKIDIGSGDLSKPTQEVATQWSDEITRQVKTALGDDADVEAMATQQLQRADVADAAPTIRGRALLDLAIVDIRLQRYAQAEDAARALAALKLHDYRIGPDSVFRLSAFPWAEVLLAQAQVGQARKVEATRTLGPALAQLQQMQALGIDNVPFCQVFARALYVQSLA